MTVEPGRNMEATERGMRRFMISIPSRTIFLVSFHKAMTSLIEAMHARAIRSSWMPHKRMLNSSATPAPQRYSYRSSI